MKVLDSCCVFQFMKDGIVTMIDLFCGGFGFAPDNNRLALLQFSTKPFVHYFFNEDQSPDALKLAVQNMTNFGGRTCTGDAMIEAHDIMFDPNNGLSFLFYEFMDFFFWWKVQML